MFEYKRKYKLFLKILVYLSISKKVHGQTNHESNIIGRTAQLLTIHHSPRALPSTYNLI